METTKPLAQKDRDLQAATAIAIDLDGLSDNDHILIVTRQPAAAISN